MSLASSNPIRPLLTPPSCARLDRAASKTAAVVRGRPRLVVAVLCIVVLSLIALPAPAFAARSPRAIGKDLASKQAQAAQVEAQLEAMRSELTSGLAQYERAEALLDVTHQEMAMTALRLDELEAEIARGQAELDERTVWMYKNGRSDMLEVLFGVGSLNDLLMRLDLLTLVQHHDAALLGDLQKAREQSTQLRAAQQRRESQLVAYRQQAEARRAQVQAEIERQQALVRSIGSEVAQLVKRQEEARAAELAALAQALEHLPEGIAVPPVGFDPDTIVTDASFQASTSMTAAQIQAFLEQRSGTLATYSAADHNGVTKTAAQMIADAAVAWGVSPKVILVTLQKEQSLLEKKRPAQKSYDWAMGCGKADSVTYYQYQGFGNQIWWGAQKLNKNRGSWKSGISLTIDGAAVYPTNASTHSLYRYTPHFGGVTSFWRLYWNYFGDPMK